MVMSTDERRFHVRMHEDLGDCGVLKTACRKELVVKRAHKAILGVTMVGFLSATMFR